MSNEELIAEARRWPRAQGVEPSRAPAELIADLADALEAETVEPEWEYQWGEPGETFEGFDSYSTYEEARAVMRKESDYESHRVMRRRKAGQWEPVEGGTDV